MRKIVDTAMSLEYWVYKCCRVSFWKWFLKFSWLSCSVTGCFNCLNCSDNTQLLFVKTHVPICYSIFTAHLLHVVPTVNLSTNFISLSPTNICRVKYEVKRYQSTKMYQPSNFQGEGRKKKVFKTTVNHMICHMVGFSGLKNHIYKKSSLFTLILIVI